MLTDEQKLLFSSLKVELIDLNILACFFVRKVNRLGYLMQHSTRYFLFEELIALRYMENGIILHLTNLDDDTSEYSFRKILKLTNATYKNQNGIKTIKKKFENYRKIVNKLKVKYRNKRIAHLNYTEDINFDEFLNFDLYLKPLIEEANAIGDFIWDSKIEYKLKLGKHEEILNFREICNKLKIDLNDQKEFI